jgi:hypothetical protein
VSERDLAKTKKGWSPQMVEYLCPGPVVAVVETDDHGRQALWELTGQTPAHPAQAKLGLRPLHWQGSGSGTFMTLCRVEDQERQWEVNLQITVQKLEGSWVAFVAPCSMAVDFEMCDQFIDAIYPGVPRVKPSSFRILCDLLALPKTQPIVGSAQGLHRAKP